MSTKLYDHDSVIIIFGTFELAGFGETSKVVVERDEDSFTKKVGLDGECTRNRNRNKCGSIKVTLMKSSSSNLVLATLLAADEESPNGASILPIIVKDTAGFSLHTALDAWVKGMPPSATEKEVTENEWVIDCGPMINLEGGN